MNSVMSSELETPELSKDLTFPIKKESECILSDTPLITISPNKKWLLRELNDIWIYRELLYFLTWRDIKVKYKQTVLGAAWAIIQPVFTMLIFTIFFGKLAGIHSDGIPYPIFAYAGLLPWTFFSNAINNSGNSLIGSANLITKVYFPRIIIPGAAVLAGIVDLAIAFIVLAVLMIYYKIGITLNLLVLPVLVILTSLLALGVGLLMSALNVKYRDIRYALPFLIQLWMFITPIIYPTSLIPARWKWLILLNPLTGIINNYRASLLGQNFDLIGIATSIIITVLILMYSISTFHKMERTFADHV